MSLPEKPLTRRELYLAKAAGQDVTLPETDLTREEMYLREIANGGGGGDVTKEYVDTAIANAVADIDDDISALSDTVADKVDKVNGKGLSTNDYTDADKALVQDSPITVTATASPISTANGKPRAITIYGKSEVVDGAIKSAGEGYAVVDLGTLAWNYDNFFYSTTLTLKVKKVPNEQIANILIDKYTTVSRDTLVNEAINNVIAINSNGTIQIRDTAYTNPEAFKTAMSGVLLCYQLEDPTQGNTIAIKTDDGSGISGTMATFTTGTPLRGIPETTVRDVMEWDGSAGTVTKNCYKIKLKDIITSYSSQYNFFYSFSITSLKTNSQLITPKYNYIGVKYDAEMNNAPNMSIAISGTQIKIKDTDYTTVSEFVASLGDTEVVCELATPVVEPLTTAENASIAGLRTFTPQTHAQNNAGADMKIEAYANTANGQAISDMQPTRSPLLTLTASGWTNNAQTVTFVHDTGRRNSIDVEPTSIKAWTAAGILATSETASTITFECDTVPTADLSFRVTSMEVR